MWEGTLESQYFESEEEFLFLDRLDQKAYEQERAIEQAPALVRLVFGPEVTVLAVEQVSVSTTPALTPVNPR
jgi:hypothetical protein